MQRSFPDALRGIGELAGCRDHGDRLRQTLRRVRIGQRAEDLETQLRDAVAVVAERQVLENDIGRAAIGWRVGLPHLRRMNGSAVWLFVARIPAPGDPGSVQQLTVGPDAANARDRPLAQCDREAGIVEVFGGLDLAATPAALAAALRGGLGLLAEIRRPDDVAADPHAAIEARDHRPFGGRGDAQIVHPRAFDPLGRREGRDDPAVDDRADGGADEAADGGRADAEDRAANAAANGGTCGTKNEGGHGMISALREQEGEGDAPPPGWGERFLDHAEALVGVEETVGPGEDPDMLGDGAGRHPEQDQRAGTGLCADSSRSSCAARPRPEPRAARSRPSPDCRAGSGTARGRRLSRQTPRASPRQSQPAPRRLAWS